MIFSNKALNQKRPDSVRQNVILPRRQQYFPSPGDWHDVVLYFLLVDRFSDGREAGRPLLDRNNLSAARPNIGGKPWRWDLWAESGGARWQGGTLKGVRSKLSYLKGLGITAIWLSPVFKQRCHLDTYHGYGIQDLLDVDPHFGDRRDLIDLVDAAHAEGLRIILDIIFNHSGTNWVYPGGMFEPPYLPYPDCYPFGAWLDAQVNQTDAIRGKDDGVWPVELQGVDCYTRAGTGSLDGGSIDDLHAEHKRTDFSSLRDFSLSTSNMLTNLAICYKYWIALTDCDGFRIDTLKHVSFDEARNFCGSIKEFTDNIGKSNFFLVGEIAGGDTAENRYLHVLSRNLNAALDIGENRLALNGVAKGIVDPIAYFSDFNPEDPKIGSHRNLGERHVSILDDHDHVFGEKVRFSIDASSDHQVVAGVALQLLTLAIPCIYYGTEQALAGPEPSERQWLPGWKKNDCYLREAMFGPEHLRKPGCDGLAESPSYLDTNLPGFGSFGTAGHHCFDPQNQVYVRIAAIAALRRDYPVLRYGRQYARPISLSGKSFSLPGPGEIVAWSRTLDDEEMVCILNANGLASLGADVLVDANLNTPSSALTVVLNTAQVANPVGYTGTHPVGSHLPVQSAASGTAYVKIRDVQSSEVLVLTNHSEKDEGNILS